MSEYNVRFRVLVEAIYPGDIDDGKVDDYRIEVMVRPDGALSLKDGIESLCRLAADPDKPA